MSDSPNKGGRPPKQERPPEDLRIISDEERSARLSEELNLFRYLFKSHFGLELPQALLRQFSPDEIREGGDAAVHNALDLLKADPMRNESLAELFVPVIAGHASDWWKRSIGDFVILALEHESPELLEHIFKRVVTLKRTFVDADYRHRNYFAYRAYLDYRIEFASEPSKPELKAYILARPKIYKNAPLDKKDWTRLWKASGLSGLANSRVRKVGKKP